MARIDDIIKQMNDAQAAEPDLVTLNSPSQTAIYTLWKYIQGLQYLLVETLINFKKAEIETTVTSAISPSDLWVQKKVFEFQYSATVPQIMALNNFSPNYPIIDATLRIVSRCSVKTTGQRIVTVKVATGEPPAALSGPQLSALTGYLNQGGDGTISGAGTGIGYAGVQFKTISVAPDLLYLKGFISYNGQYSAIIQANVIAAINLYLATLPFTGIVTILALTDAIQSVPGVTDIALEDVVIRASATAFGAGTGLISSFTQLQTSCEIYGGYIIEETIAGKTFSDQLTFAAQ